MRFRRLFPSLLAAVAVGLVSTTAPQAVASPGQASASEMAHGLIMRAERRRLAGDVARALEDYARAAAIAPSEPEKRYAAVALGSAQYEAGRFSAAVETLGSVLGADDTRDAVAGVAAATLAVALLERQTVETSVERDRRLRRSDDWRAEAMAIAQTLDPGLGRASIEILIMRQLTRRGAADRAVGAATMAGRSLDREADGAAAAYARVSLGDGLLEIGSDDATTAAGAQYARATATDVARVRALALLGAAEVALRVGDWARARRLSAEALVEAGAGDMGDVAFAALWLSADASMVAGDRRAAQIDYEEAMAALRSLRRATPLGTMRAIPARRFQARRFQKDYLDFLLNPQSTRQDLRRAIDVVEDLKVDEVEEYFARRCVPDDVRSVDLSRLATDYAIFYPIVLDDRIEIILAASDFVARRTAALGEGELRRLTDSFRYLLETPGADVRAIAGALYDALVRPFEPALRRLAPETLVFSPDGPLRAIPLAALWDGDGFLVERYAIATVLGLQLVDSAPLKSDALEAFVGGAADAPGFPALPAVPGEVAAVSAAIGGVAVLDRDFATRRLEAELGGASFDVIHLASHAEFGADPDDNFIATSDGRLGMDQLELLLRLRAVRDARPLGLLTLSACSTAAGAGRLALERAPLGLASVAYRSGARSVLASLWRADDRATAQLMTMFYREIALGASRGAALQRAQSQMLRSRRSRHPAFWANFILIGDWR